MSVIKTNNKLKSCVHYNTDSESPPSMKRLSSSSNSSSSSYETPTTSLKQRRNTRKLDLEAADSETSNSSRVSGISERSALSRSTEQASDAESDVKSSHKTKNRRKANTPKTPTSSSGTASPQCPKLKHKFSKRGRPFKNKELNKMIENKTVSEYVDDNEDIDEAKEKNIKMAEEVKKEKKVHDQEESNQQDFDEKSSLSLQLVYDR